MNREELLRLFEVDGNDIIISEGFFQGQALYIAYFWYFYVTGYTEDKQDEILSFTVRGEDRAQFPILHGREKVRLQALADGRIIEVDHNSP